MDDGEPGKILTFSMPEGRKCQGNNREKWKSNGSQQLVKKRH
jgi:hypothetical protein